MSVGIPFQSLPTVQVMEIFPHPLDPCVSWHDLSLGNFFPGGCHLGTGRLPGLRRGYYARNEGGLLASKKQGKLKLLGGMNADYIPSSLCRGRV